MYSANELKERIDYLKAISAYSNSDKGAVPSYLIGSGYCKAKEFFDELEKTIDDYLNRDSEFELQVNKTLDKVIADVFHKAIEFERQELIDVWKTPRLPAPIGYDKVLDLFKGDEVFKEIMTVSDKDFKAEFYKIENEDGSLSYKYGNNYLDSWIEELSSAMLQELAGLKAIMQYCANHSYNVEWAILFEDHGRNINYHPVRYFAKDIFVTKGYGWLIETFNLSIYRPSYMKDLVDWNDV